MKAEDTHAYQCVNPACRRTLHTSVEGSGALPLTVKCPSCHGVSVGELGAATRGKTDGVWRDDPPEGGETPLSDIVGKAGLMFLHLRDVKK